MVRILPWLLLACSPSRCGPERVARDSHADSSTAADTADSDDSASPDTGDSGDTSDASLPDTSETGDTAPPAPPDIDGDGHVDHASGGDDCDDQNAHVYPGAPEMCDDADQDCDGDGWLGADCGSTQDIAAMGVLLTGSPYGVPRIVRDVTGDGVSDIQDGDYREIEPLGRAYWTATSIPENPGTFPADNNVAAFYEYSDLINHRLDFGDVDGDGFNDVGHVPGGVYGYDTLLYKGPIPTDGTWVPEGSTDYEWTANPDIEWGDCWSCEAITGDWNGDGLGDLALSAWDDTEPKDDGGVIVYWGGDFGGSRRTLGGDYIRHLWSLGDVTGDGADDIAVADQCQINDTCVGWLDGADLSGASDLERPIDIAFTTVIDPDYTSTAWAGIRDWDGDGLLDPEVFAWPSSGDYEVDGERLIFVNSGSSELSIGDAAGGYQTGGTVLQAGIGSGSDTCAFGGAEHALYQSGGLTWVLFEVPSGLPPRGSLPPERLVVLEESGSAACGDVTGDGADDLVFGVQEDWMNGDQIRIIPGWSIPWDDDTYWP